MDRLTRTAITIAMIIWTICLVGYIVILKTNSANENVRSFVDMLSDSACEIEKRTGASACFIVSQSALETAWGKSILMVRDSPDTQCAKKTSNNLFNIKWSSNCGYDFGYAYVWEQKPTGEKYWIWDKFCVYRSFTESMEHWLKLISTNPRYARAWDSRHSVVEFAKQMQKCGYATAINYADQIIGVSKSLYVVNDDADQGRISSVSVRTNT